jgi:xanthosine utilization system XapX-like protein
MVDITEISAVVAAAGVLVGVVYYILDMRHQSKLRQTDFITRLYSTYGSKEFHDMVMEIQSLQFDDYEDFVKKYGPWFSKGPAQTAIYVVATYLSEVGILLRRKIIDIDFFYDIFGSAAVCINWEKLKPLILGIREQRHNSGVFSPFEYLYNELQKKEQRSVSHG